MTKATRAVEKARATVHEVAEAAMNIEKPRPEDLFRNTFAELPPELVKQMQTMRTDSIGQDPTQLGLQSRPVAFSRRALPAADFPGAPRHERRARPAG